MVTTIIIFLQAVAFRMLLYWLHLQGAFPISGKATISVSLTVRPH